MTNTRTGLWGIIDWWNNRFRQIQIRRERHLARERELAAAKERIRRDRSAFSFDRKIAIRRSKGDYR